MKHDSFVPKKFILHFLAQKFLLLWNIDLMRSSQSDFPIVHWSCTVRCCYTADPGRYWSSSRSARPQILLPSGKRRERAPGLLGSCGKWWRGGCTAAAETSCCPDPWLQPELGGSSLQRQMGPVEIQDKMYGPFKKVSFSHIIVYCISYKYKQCLTCIAAFKYSNTEAE